MTSRTKADRRLHPTTLIASFLRTVPETVLGLPALVGMVSSARIGTLLLLAAAGALFAAGIAALKWFRFGYGISPSHIVIESGILARQRRSIPFDRVQDVTIERPLLARLFGTAVVKIETGSAGKHEGVLNSISLAEAQQLRDLIRTAEAADFPREKDEVAHFGAPPLFAMGMPRLLLAGMFNFSLLFLALIAGLVEFVAPLMGFDLVDHHRWMSRLGAAADRLSVRAIIAIAAALLLLGLLSGIAQTMARDYRFRLLRTETGFHRRRGLLTLSEAAFPADRVQIAILQTGPVRRLLGWFRLEFQTLASRGDGAGHQVVAPLARVPEILPILNELDLATLPPFSAYARVSRRLVIHRSVEYLVVLGAAAIAAELLWPPGLFLLGLFPVCIAFAELQWRHHSYCIGRDAIHVRHGVFSQRLWAIPLDKVQAITVTRSLAQRGLGLATLMIDTAGASRFINPKIVDVEESFAETLARSLVPRLIASDSLSAAQDSRLSG